MNGKLQFLQLENSTVKTLRIEDMLALKLKIPELWYNILVISDKKERANATVKLWRRYLDGALPYTIMDLTNNLEDIELMEKEENGKKVYSLLYTINREDDRKLFYEGLFPKNINEYISYYDSWEYFPKNIRNFYEQIHNGFYHYANRGMGLQPIQYTSFEEDDGGEWNLEYGDFSDDYYVNNIAFYRNSLGLAISINSEEGKSKNAILWSLNIFPKVNVCFWKIVDKLLLFF